MIGSGGEAAVGGGVSSYSGGLESPGLAGPPPSSVANDPERLREAVYVASLTSLEATGRCQQEGRDARTVLDAVFNACMDDALRSLPAGSGGGGGGSSPSYPAWPAEVDAADRGVPPPAPAVPTMPPAPAPNVGIPGVDETHKQKWGEA